MLFARVKPLRHWPWYAIGLVALIVLGSAVCVAAYTRAYAGRIYPGVEIGQVDVGGLTPAEAQLKLQRVWDHLAGQGLSVMAGQRSLTLYPIVSSPTDPDVTFELIRFEAPLSADRAYQAGRQGSWFTQLLQPLLIRLTPPNVPAQADIDWSQVVEYLRDNLTGLEVPATSARVVVDQADNLTVAPGKRGLAIDQARLSHDLVDIVQNFDTAEPLEVQLVEVPPPVDEASVLAALPQVRALLKPGSLNFSWQQAHWSSSPSEWHHWLEVRALANGATEVGLSTTAASEFFKPIVQSVNQPAQDARFELKNGRAVTFEPSQAGFNLDVAATLAAAEQALKAGTKVDLPLVVNETKPTVRTADVNSLGITDLIGVGMSDFTGSPPHRIHNISVGADALNGVLVKPGEEFSLVRTLGEISDKTGYLQELVIKGNKTVPEFGGGLCQIGTTTFRAALASGLPILERRNHSYRVSYYEPAGTDATIYDPKPDFRFKNDTPGSILIQTKMKGTKLIFEFWGQPDGRKVDQTKPQLSNITPPPPPKLVPTEDLPVGQKKCTEHAHNGADTEFTYTVTYADSHQAQQVFKSHYVPWQEVCLIGVPKGSLPANGGDATALPSIDTQGVHGN